jgi:hypothetical protein
MDFFGQSLYYIHHTDYDKPKPNQIRALLVKSEQPVDVKAIKSPSTNTWANPGRFQLMGAGKDGKFGTPDDVRGW